MKLHEIKLLEGFAIEKLQGRKSFEIRKNDRNYQVGDLIIYKIIREEDDYEYNSPISLDWMNIDDYFSNRIYQIEYITDYAQQDGYIVWQERELISGQRLDWSGDDD